MPKNSLFDLIVKVEAAWEYDRGLDQMIAELCAPTNDPRSASFQSGDDYPRNYTKSIDAALTLVPNGFRFLIRDHDPKEPRQPEGKGKRAFANVYGRKDDEPMFGAYHQTPALALCVAALEARAALDVSSRKQDSGNNKSA